MAGTEDAASLKARYPRDNGTDMVADQDLTEAIAELIAARTSRTALEAREEALETAVKTRMGEAAVLTGQGFRVTWKRTKDREETDWRFVADGLLSKVPETERAALVGLATTVRPGFRPFRVVTEKEAS